MLHKVSANTLLVRKACTPACFSSHLQLLRGDGWVIRGTHINEPHELQQPHEHDIEIPAVCRMHAVRPVAVPGPVGENAAGVRKSEQINASAELQGGENCLHATAHLVRAARALPAKWTEDLHDVFPCFKVRRRHPCDVAGVKEINASASVLFLDV